MTCSWPKGSHEPGNWRSISARYQASESRGASMTTSSIGIMLRAEDHRLQVEAPARGQHRGDVREEVAVDLVLAPGAIAPRASRSARTRRGWRRRRSAPKLSRSTVARVVRRGRRGRGAGRPRPAPRTASRRRPCAPRARMKLSSGPQPQPRSSTRRPGSIPICSATYSCLRRCACSRRQREVAVVLGAAEVGQLAQAEAKDPVDQRVGELEVVAGRPWRSGNVATAGVSRPMSPHPRARKERVALLRRNGHS